MRQAERERRKKYKAQNDEREVVRSAIREKVGTAWSIVRTKFCVLQFGEGLLKRILYLFAKQTWRS